MEPVSAQAQAPAESESAERISSQARPPAGEHLSAQAPAAAPAEEERPSGKAAPTEGERSSGNAPAATGEQRASATHAEVHHTSSAPPPSADTTEPVLSTTVVASLEGVPETHAPPAAPAISDPDPAAEEAQLSAAAFATGAAEVSSRPVSARKPEPGVRSSTPPPPAFTAAAAMEALHDGTQKHDRGHTTDDEQDRHAGGLCRAVSERMLGVGT